MDHSPAAGRGVAIRVFDLAGDSGLSAAIAGEGAAAIEWRAGDVSDGATVLEAARGCDLLIHLAAILTPACQADPLRAARINLIGTLNVFEAARALGHDHVLYMSSAGVFGAHDGKMPGPTTHYGAFKLAGEGSARAYWEDHRIASVGFRPTVVYGPGRETGLTAGATLACRAATRGETYDIPFGGSTDFVYVDDVACAFEATLNDPPEGPQVFNVCGEVAPVTCIVEAIRHHVPDARIGVTGPPIPMASDIEDNRLREAFPAVPRTSIDEGVQRTIEH